MKCFQAEAFIINKEQQQLISKLHFDNFASLLISKLYCCIKIKTSV